MRESKETKHKGFTVGLRPTPRRQKGVTRRCRDCGRLLRFGLVRGTTPAMIHAPGAGKLCREARARRAARAEREAR